MWNTSNNNHLDIVGDQQGGSWCELGTAFKEVTMNEIINIFNKLIVTTWFRIVLTIVTPIISIIIWYKIAIMLQKRELNKQRKVDLGITWKE